MLKQFKDHKLNSKLILTYDLDSLYRFRNDDHFKIIWNRDADLTISFDANDITIGPEQLICLTPLQQPIFKHASGRQFILLFNKEFYCIHENDHEVSCEGLLFWGSSDLPLIKLDDTEQHKFESLFNVFIDELDTRDNIQGEMLRMLLKRLIIKSTRLARKQHFPEQMGKEQTELIRRFNVLVEQYFKTHHQVADYAEMLYKSPKTLSNVFAAAGHKSPLEVIHSRIVLESKRLLIKTDSMAKEIAFEMGFEDQSHFSRFFKKETGKPPSIYRKEVQYFKQGKN